MSSILGNILKLSVWGESHGKAIGCTLDGLPSGLSLDLERISKDLDKRRGLKELSTARREKDQFEILSGYFNGHTTGTPLTFMIRNEDVDDKVYDDTKNILRPGHADYTAFLKYEGYQDYRGGGHFSGRITAPIVIAGSIAKQILEEKGIVIGSRIKEIHGIKDESKVEDYEKTIKDLNELDFPTLDSSKANEMKNEIIKAREQLDSVGGIVETYALVNDYVLGEPMFDSVESKISQYIFSVGGVKGISFGLGFDFASKRGSEVKDEYELVENKIVTKNNNNGGILGGITSLQPIVFDTVIKPTASIGQTQKTVDFKENKEVELSVKGRHDPCIVPKALQVINALTALALLDLLMEEYGRKNI
jgi:chorismate synthase